MDSEKELLSAIRLGEVAEVRRLVNASISVRARRVGKIEGLPIPLVLMSGDGEISPEVFPETYFPLHLAVSFEDIEIVQILLDAGAEVNFKDEGKDSPLHKAVGTRNIQMVEMLLERGADPNAKNIYHDTPVFFAGMDNDVHMVEVLAQRGARLDCQNCDGDTPLHRALDSTEMVRALIGLGANVNIQNYEGNTPLHLAIRNRVDMVIIRDLVTAKNADINIQNEEGNTALHLIASYSAEMVRVLIGLGANVNIQNYKGNTPLHLAVQNRVDMVTIIDLVTARNADVNIQNKKGNTALHLITSQAEYEGIKNTVSFIRAKEVGKSCRKKGSIGDIVRVLMTSGADSSIKNKRGKVPKHDSITEVLEEKPNSTQVQKPSCELSNVNSENCQTFLARLGIE